jgi:succinoglycan biosynthesis protein ExoH
MVADVGLGRTLSGRRRATRALSFDTMTEGVSIARLGARLRRGLSRHVSPAAPAHLSRAIDLGRIVLIVGIVFLHYGMYPNLRANPFGGMSILEHEVATFVNSFLLFFFFSVVPLLSAISGWLFFNFLEHPEKDVAAALGTRIRKRFFSLYVPLVTWNFLYLVLLLFVSTFVPDHPLFAALNIDFDTASPRQYFNAVFAVDHHPLAFQFWFVRDLFLTVLLSPVLWLVIKRAPLMGAVALFGAWIVNYDFAIFFRPDVTFFFYLGGLVRAKKVDLRLGGRAVIAMVVLYLALVTLRSLAPYVVQHSSALLAGFTRLMRLVGVLACWGVFMRVAETPIGARLARLGPFAFFLYATHFPLMAEVKLQLWKLLPETNDFWMVVHYLASVSITIALCLGGAHLLARYSPDTFALLNGGRGPKIRRLPAQASRPVVSQRADASQAPPNTNVAPAQNATAEMP